MTGRGLREQLEAHQVVIYFSVVVSAAMLGVLVSGTRALEAAINPAIGLMLFVTFLQVPLRNLGRAFTRVRFLVALFSGNFLVVPLLLALLLPFFELEPMIKLGVLLVLLTPCIDYVITFAQMGGADARLLLSATPALLIAQMVLLPVYLGLFLGDTTMAAVHPGPFLHAFVWLIAVPLFLAALVQCLAGRTRIGHRTATALGVLPVPATALVLFIVVVAMVPQISAATEAALAAVPVYVAFAVTAPVSGWLIARLFRLDAAAGRAVAFSMGTRNSLVVLPLALAIPGAMPILPAIIMTQTMIELLAELVYVRLIPRLGKLLP